MNSASDSRLVHFFLPRRRFPNSIPTQIDPTDVQLQNSAYGEILQTYVHLQQANYPCKLVSALPDEGIAIAHRESFEPSGYLQASPRLFLLSLQDSHLLPAQAQFHIVQSPYQKAQLDSQQIVSDHLPPWPTPGIQPREIERGERFERVAYIGHLQHLSDALKQYSFREEVHRIGLHWQTLIHFQDRADYRNIDAIVAISQPSDPIYQQVYSTLPKGPTYTGPIKLYDAWIAGVPIVLGDDGDYLSLRQNSLDYARICADGLDPDGSASSTIDKNSYTSAITALKRLQSDGDLRRDMVENGHRRAAHLTVTNITQQWINFLEKIALPAYNLWQKSSEAHRETTLAQQQQLCQLAHMQYRVSAGKDYRERPFDLAHKL